MNHLQETIGIMADSHGNNGQLSCAIGVLRSKGARVLVHLGDMCDTRSPHLMEETFRILSEHDVRAVRGNNECQTVHDMKSSRDGTRGGETLEALEALPYVMSLGPFWFAHSAPYPFPAATRRPVSEFLQALLDDPGIPFEVLFRGHSHQPSILGVNGRTVEELQFQMDRDIHLDRDRRYIVTVGAVERASSALFLPGERVLRFVTLPGV